MRKVESLVSISELSNALGVSRVTIHRLIKNQDMPEPIRHQAGSVKGWKFEQIAEWALAYLLAPKNNNGAVLKKLTRINPETQQIEVIKP